MADGNRGRVSWGVRIRQVVSILLVWVLVHGPAWATDLTPPQLASRPGAAYTLYLNFSGFEWNNPWAGKIPGIVPAYTKDGDATTFNGLELSNIREIWSRVAAKYSMFDVNVTTVDPAGTGLADADRQAYYNAQAGMMHTVIGGSNAWYSAGAGGVSGVGTAPNTYGPTAQGHLNWVFPVNVGSNKNLAEAIAHEDGHGIAISHQADWDSVNGTLIQGYSTGVGSGVGSYAPIMGVAYSAERSLWSVGTRNNGALQHDVAAFLGKANFSVIPATAGQTWQTATPMTGLGGAVEYNLSKGVIATKVGLSSPDAKAASSYTTDYWSFTTSGGNVTLNAMSGQSTITPGIADPDPTLDAFIQLLDSNGDVVASSAGYDATTAGHLNATIDTNLAAGTYYVRVSNTLGPSGAGLLDTRYTERSFFDMGSYFLTGTIPGLADETTQYWDNAGGNGFGNAASTWSAATDNQWNTSSTGNGGRGTNVGIASIDSVHFGTDSNGLGAGTVNVSGTVTANRITFGSASGAITLSGGTITMTSIAPTITVNNASSTIGSVLAGNAGVTKEGTGTLVLGGANTFTGPLNVAAGTMALTGNASLSRMSSINTSAADARFDVSGIAGESITVGSLTGVANSQIVLGAKNLTTDPATDTTYAGVISGAGGSLTKTGMNTLTLSAANTYTGATTVSGGSLSLTSNGALPNSTVNLTASGQRLTLSGITPASTSVGAIEGVNGSSIVLGAKNLNTGGNGASTTFAGVISGSGGSLTKTGDGALTLTGANTYTGATTISAGALILDATGSLASSLVTVQADGTFGGAGTISGNVSFANGSFFDVSSALASNPLDRDWLAVGGTVTFSSSFGVGSLLGIDWDTIEFGTYTLISTSQVNWGSLDNFGLGDPYFDVGSGKSAYFVSGSLNLVVVPEPNTLAFLGAALAGMVLLRRRRLD